MNEADSQFAPEDVTLTANVIRTADWPAGDGLLTHSCDVGIEFLLRTARRSHPHWWTPIDTSREETSVFVG